MNKAIKFNLLIMLLAGGLSAFISRPVGLEIVKTESGKISGIQNKEGDIAIYKGIPFAAPPVGDLRWKAPQPVKSWPGVRQCISFGPSPMQGEPKPFSMWSAEFLIPKEPISEDCLYLNLWSGATSSSEKRPVLVWIYGGGFNSGGSAVPIYDGEAMAKKGIIFVSINYRVGPFGFFAHPELTKESGNKASGNYGLLDQIAALKWVKQNIRGFGGDPDNVTIAGQSAGAMSVNCLVASPLAKGLFNKAIAQSGASFSGANITLPQAEQEGLKAAQEMNAASVADLGKIPADQILKKIRGQRPIIDSYVLPNSIVNIFTANKQNPVSLLTGWNEDEGLLSSAVKNADDYRKNIEIVYGADAKAFLQFYPASSDAEAAKSQLRISRDIIFGTQNYTWANIQSKQGKQKAYVYRFARKVPATGEYLKYGAFHTGEVPYTYDNLKFVNRPWEPLDQQLAKDMSSYWANFVKNGDPNGKGLPIWPAYEVTTKKTMIFDQTPVPATLPDHASLDFLYNQLKKKNKRHLNRALSV